MSTELAVEYVAESDTIADITLKETASASLRTSNAILLAALLLASFILNGILITTVLSNTKLRSFPIYILYAHFSLIHLIDLSFSILLSLIFVANGAWVLGQPWCKVNTLVQEFCQLYSLLSLMLMAAERAVGCLFIQETTPDPIRPPREKLFTGQRLAVFSLGLAIVALAIAIPTATDAIPVKPFKNRYVCGIDGDCPISYPIARVIIYIGCLVVQLVCVGCILKKRSENTLPSQSHEYSDFIKRNRAMQEHMSRARLVIFLLVVFIIVVGPYATLSFTYEICNSSELLHHGVPLDVPQDADTLITWLKFLYPLLSPIIIFCWCNDIWMRVKELFCCRSYDPPSITHYMRGAQVPGVMTLVATNEGLQLKMPSAHPMYAQPPAGLGQSLFFNSKRRVSPTEMPPPRIHPTVRQSIPQQQETSEAVSIASTSSSKAPKEHSAKQNTVSRTKSSERNAQRTKKTQRSTKTKSSKPSTIPQPAKAAPAGTGGIKKKAAQKKKERARL